MSNINKDNNNEPNIELLKTENISLREQIRLLKEKELSYQSSISKIKQTQSEFEQSYKNALSDYNKQQEELKNKYLEYQSILEKQNEDNEKSYVDELLLLEIKLKEKDEIIKSLTEKIKLLNEKLSKAELNYYFKEKEYEEIIVAKEKKLSELNESIKQIVQEATEEIKRLSGQLEEFQKRGKKINPVDLFIEKEIKDNNNINNNIKNNFANNQENNMNINLNKSVDNILNNNINSIKSFKQNDIIQQSQNIINNSVLLSDNFKNILKDTNTPQKANKSFIINHHMKNKQPNNDLPMYYTQNKFYGKNEQDIMTQLYLLQNEKTVLTNELKKKEKEVNFWKNLRTDLYNNNMRQGIYTMINSPNKKYMNDIKIKNMEKTLNNYGNKIKEIKKQYNESLRNHQREIEKLRNDMENSINFTQQSRIYDRNNEDDYDDNEQKSINEDLLHALKINIPSKEGIRNEYINSQVQKIKNLDNDDNFNE